MPAATCFNLSVFQRWKAYYFYIRRSRHYIRHYIPWTLEIYFFWRGWRGTIWETIHQRILKCDQWQTLSQVINLYYWKSNMEQFGLWWIFRITLWKLRPFPFDKINFPIICWIQVSSLSSHIVFQSKYPTLFFTYFHFTPLLPTKLSWQADMCNVSTSSISIEQDIAVVKKYIYSEFHFMSCSQ